MALGGVSIMAFGERSTRAVPCLGFEAVVVLEVHLDALAQRAEEGGLVLRVPAEAWALAVGGGAGGGVLAGRDRARIGGHGLDGLGGIVLVVRHGGDGGGRERGRSTLRGGEGARARLPGRGMRPWTGRSSVEVGITAGEETRRGGGRRGRQKDVVVVIVIVVVDVVALSVSYACMGRFSRSTQRSNRRVVLRRKG